MIYKNTQVIFKYYLCYIAYNININNTVLAFIDIYSGRYFYDYY